MTLSHLSKRPSDLKQNGTQKRHHFLEQFSKPFHKMCFILLWVVASKNIEYKLLIGCPNISTSQKVFFWATTRNKTDHTMWKGIENCARKWCLFVYPFVWGHLGALKDVPTLFHIWWRLLKAKVYKAQLLFLQKKEPWSLVVYGLVCYSCAFLSVQFKWHLH